MEKSANAISFHTETLGLIHSIWPIDNHYFTEFDSISFGIRKYTKSINQGRYSGEMDCYYDISSSQLKYKNKSIFVTDSVQNIFTLLARVSHQSIEDLDTKWFPMNHEGVPYRARFLWAGVDTLDINNTNMVCDYYRLDTEKTKGESFQLSPWDYFTDHVVSNEAVRQIWVNQTGKRWISKATVSIYGMTVTAEIQDK